MRASDSEWRVGCGDMFTLWPGVRIEYFEEKEDPWEFIWMHLIGSGAPDYVSTCGFSKNKPFLRAADPDSAIKRFASIHEALALRSPANAYSILSTLYEIPSFCALPNRDESQTGNPRRELVERVTATLETLLHTSPSVKELAAMFNVSRVTLFRAFNESLGVSPIEYLDRQRIAKATSLLSNTSHPIGFVAKACGYCSPKYFMRRFKAVTGTTPTEFRISRQQ